MDLDAFERRVRMAGDLIAKRDRKRTWKKGFMGIRDFQYPPLTVKEAREFFDAFTMAGLMLAVIEVTSGDANGQIRRWDARWGPLTTLPLTMLSAPRTGDIHDCVRPEIEALVQGIGTALFLARGGLTAGDSYSMDELANKLAQGRLTADEAQDRRTGRLSCESLPMAERYVSGRPSDFSSTVGFAVAIDGIRAYEKAEQIRRSQREAAANSRIVPGADPVGEIRRPNPE